MVCHPESVSLRSVGEWALSSKRVYKNPFADVQVDATFYGPSDAVVTVPAFYDGNGTWRIRFNPGEEGEWAYRISARPRDPELETEGRFDVSLGKGGHGFLKATPEEAWGFRYESGEPVFLLGDTTYNLFGMAHCGADVASFLERRAGQGFNLFRVRLSVSSFHPPEAYSVWQDRSTWPWGGSPQNSLLDRFNLDYFRTVDRVIAKAEALGLGFEMIMEAFASEIPFCNRARFLPEWEELWLRYLVARYDAYNSVYFWTLMNEYEKYPDGDWRYDPVADRWAMRVGHWMKRVATHGHIISVHNGPRMPAFAERFTLDPGAIDAIMFQDWGARDETFAWLATGIEDQIAQSLAGWAGSAVFAEWGYERNPEFPLVSPGLAYCDQEHTRRGAWRGAFCALGLIGGYENSWGPFCKLDEDQPGLTYLLHLRRFFSEIVPFDRLQPAGHLVQAGEGYAPGTKPLALASEEGDTIAVYFPVGGEVSLALRKPAEMYAAQWFNPCTGELSVARFKGMPVAAPAAMWNGHPQDWVLVLRFN